MAKVVLLGFAALLLSCTPGGDTPKSEKNNNAASLEELRARSVKLPNLRAGETCRPSQKGQVTSPSAVTVGIGGGPVYAAMGGAGRDTLAVATLHKVAFVAIPDDHKPMLIRGGQLDGNGPVLFANPYALLVPVVMTVPGPTGPIDLYPELDWVIPTYVYVSRPGCYALQVDGTGFTELIIFRADPDTRP